MYILWSLQGQYCFIIGINGLVHTEIGASGNILNYYAYFLERVEKYLGIIVIQSDKQVQKAVLGFTRQKNIICMSTILPKHSELVN